MRDDELKNILCSHWDAAWNVLGGNEREVARNHSKCCRCPSLDSKPAPPKYKPKAALLHKGRDASKSRIIGSDKV